MITTRLFEPLDMASCGFGAPTGDAPWGHYVDDGTLTPIEPGVNADNPPLYGPAGTVHCSLTDWGKFVAAHMLDARGESNVIAADSYAVLHAPWPGGDYALGWLVNRHPALGPILAHDGSNTLWYARAVIAPDANRAFLIATNTADVAGPGAVEDALEALIATAATH